MGSYSLIDETLWRLRAYWLIEEFHRRRISDAAMNDIVRDRESLVILDVVVPDEDSRERLLAMYQVVSQENFRARSSSSPVASRPTRSSTDSMQKGSRVNANLIKRTTGG